MNDLSMCDRKLECEVEAPHHYNWHPEGIECIEVREMMCSINLADAVKYIWRHQHKGHPATDIRKAIQSVSNELKRINNAAGVRQLNYAGDVMPMAYATSINTAFSPLAAKALHFIFIFNNKMCKPKATKWHCAYRSLLVEAKFALADLALANLMHDLQETRGAAT